MAGAALGAAYRHLRDIFGAGSTVGLGDGPLLARYASDRDPAAFEALVARHGPMVLATCRAVLRNEHDVEDAFQATFLVLARKAGSVRGGDALGAWLHRVAYRAAVRAGAEARRRRRKEAEASAMAPPAASRPDPDRASLLHEEIERLPERHRLPVVLCDLEGLTYEEAARRLHWTVPTLRNRLAKARQRLRDRLTRRGVGPLAPALLPAVPPALLRSAVEAATGGATPAGALALTHVILRSMLMTKLKIAATAALSGLAVASAGLIAVGAWRPEDPKPAMKPPAVAGGAAEDTPPPPGPGELVEVRGIVLAPDGRPVPGATVRPSYLRLDKSLKPLPEASSGTDGRFAIRVPRATGFRGVDGSGTFPRLVATAPGFGLGWTPNALKPAGPDGVTVRLAAAGPTIEGRVVDLEGRPVAGARVSTGRLYFAEGGDFSAWLARVRDAEVTGPWDGLEEVLLDTPIATLTDPDGRFRLAGIGPDRLADLLVTGPTIASDTLFVLTREGPEVRAVERHPMSPWPVVFHAPKFEHAAAPSRPVEGVVRDQDTGRPIAGLTLHAAVSDEDSPPWAEGLEATTDDRGRYRLGGLARGPAYRLFVEPSRGRPYTKATFRVPADSPAPEPATFDFALKRGVVVRGRVTDKATGRPAPGYVDAYAFRDNPHLGEFPGFAESHPARARLDADGRFELVALPGRGILACRSDAGRYRGGAGAEGIQGYNARSQRFNTAPETLQAGGYHTLAEVNFDAKAGSATFDLQVDPGRSLTVTALDPEGRPIGGTIAQGIGDLFQTSEYPQEFPSFEVHGLGASKPRRVTVTHLGRKLAGSVYLKGDEAGPVTVRLRPWGTIAGRIVDDEGRPRPGMGLMSFAGPQPEDPETHAIFPKGDQGGGLRLDSDGRFRIEGLVPGLKYGGSAVSGSINAGDLLFRDVTVAPGEVKDLGDLKVIPLKPEGDQ